MGRRGVDLSGKNALVFAATGAIGGEVARTFAREGARVWLSGRDAAALEKVARSVLDDRGEATIEVVDATDPVAVEAYVGRVVEEAGRIDAVFNAIGLPPVELGYPASSVTQDFELFMKPLRIVLGSAFLTSREVAARMVGQEGGGSIVTLSATLSVMAAPFMANIAAACGAIEAMTRSLAGEFGPSGVRVNCVRGNAMPETRTIQETGAGLARISGDAPQMAPPTLGRPITVSETAQTAAFLASDASSGMTGQVVTVSAGAFV
ncbi:MAG: SDR family NAD(P)-dependent oxidoreductase [Rubrobacter sp.]